MAYEQPKLPYDPSALEPNISAKTFEFHYGKHHVAYINNYNNLVKGTEYESMPLEAVIKAVAKDPAKVGIFNNGAQVWNHTFYWSCMKPNGGGEPTGELAEKIKQDFGGFDKFKEEFKNAGVSQFGSGWAWLVLDGGKLKITKTLNAGNPITDGQTPLLTMDVWEHAYYLDYQNRRPDYAQTFIDKLINWDFVSKNYSAAK